MTRPDRPADGIVCTRRMFAVALAASSLCSPVGAEVPAGSEDARAPAAPVTVTVAREGALQHVRAALAVDAPASTCYAVLADFDRLEEFVPGLRSSDVVSAAGEPLLLHQVGEARVAFFRTTLDVTLAVREDPPRRIEFERVAGNLRQMRGRWTVAGDEHRCDVAYEAEIEPAFWVPPLIGPRLMRGQVEAQLEGVLAEIRARTGERAAP